MILDPQLGKPEADSAVVAEITAEIDALCAAGASLDRAKMEELARAVEHFVREQGDDYVDSQYLLLLASQALSSIGEGEVGRRLFLFGSGMIAPAEWEVRGRETVWQLDLKHMTVRDESCLELIFFSGLRVILDSMADVWDESGGRGTLGLRHVCSAASELLGGAAGKKTVARLAEEITEVCRSRLVHIGTQREWETCPEVLNLDLGPN